MYQLYDHHNRLIQEKLQEFTQKMANISHLEAELKQVCHSVETVYKDLCQQPEVRGQLPGPAGRGQRGRRGTRPCSLGERPGPEPGFGSHSGPDTETQARRLFRMAR